MNQPCIAFGDVLHTRLRPVRHAFRYPGLFVMLPMRAWRAPSGTGGPAQAAAGWMLPRNRFGLLSFADADHGAGGPDALAWCETLLEREGVADADGEIWLLTLPRVLGRAFKPVSFWFAHRHDGSLAAVVAEVNNTFGGRHAYVLVDQPRGALAWGRELQAEKVFHVSPFCRPEGRYRFRFLRTTVAADPARPEHIVVRVDHDDADGELLRTSLSGHLQPLTRLAAWRALAYGTGAGFGVLARIHWQALRLWLKRVPFLGADLQPPRAPEPARPDPLPLSTLPASDPHRAV